MADTPPSTWDGFSSSKEINLTAYRVFRILEMLMQGSLTFEQINNRLLGDPQVKRAISLDTLNLCLNTLRVLGCEIQRPSSRNQWRYTLLKNAFFYPHTLDDQELLLQVVQAIRVFLTPDQLVQWQALLSHLESCLAFPSETILEDFGRLSDAMAGLGHEEQGVLEHLFTAKETQCPLLMTYDALGDHTLTYYFMLPQAIYANAGAYYVNSASVVAMPQFVQAYPGQLPLFQEHHAWELPTLQHRTFRLERIRWTHPAAEHLGSNVLAALIEALVSITRSSPYVVTLLLFTDLPLISPLGLNEALTLLDPAPPVLLEGSSAPLKRYWHCRVTVDDCFMLKQRLMFAGMPFQILEPTFLREEVSQHLLSMLSLYSPHADTSAQGLPLPS
jgi:hypothetical protein